jgi:hypothetical protein
VRDSDDFDAIAREHSMLYVERGGHRDAGYIGCLEGLHEYAKTHADD